jgi:hypothetical protein
MRLHILVKWLTIVEPKLYDVIVTCEWPFSKAFHLCFNKINYMIFPRLYFFQFTRPLVYCAANEALPRFLLHCLFSSLGK